MPDVVKSRTSGAPGQRFALLVAYDGTNYCGWQRQSGVLTVQAALEAALSRVAAEPIVVVTAGRTDTAVHALGQVVHFSSRADRPLRAWVQGTNTHLEPDIRVLWAAPVAKDFHARFSAYSRRYRYLFQVGAVAAPLYRTRAAWSRRDLDVDAMAAAALDLVGEHDFSSFRASTCQSKSPVRRIQSAGVTRHGALVSLEIEANAFLHHMVRNVAGCLWEVGLGKRPRSWLAELLLLNDRTAAGITAPPQGLYLLNVRYPDRFSIVQPDDWPLA